MVMSPAPVCRCPYDDVSTPRKRKENFLSFAKEVEEWNGINRPTYKLQVQGHCRTYRIVSRHSLLVFLHRFSSYPVYGRGDCIVVYSIWLVELNQLILQLKGETQTIIPLPKTRMGENPSSNKFCYTSCGRFLVYYGDIICCEDDGKVANLVRK